MFSFFYMYLLPPPSPPTHTHTGIPPWSYLLSIIDQKSTADPDIQAKAMSVINRVRV